MDLVAGAIGNLAPKLLQLLQDEYKLQKGVRKQIQFLSEELESIHGALRKVAAVPPDQLDEQVKIWARQVREASYDMEDILDAFLVRVEGRPEEPSDQGRLKGAVKRMAELFVKAKARRDIANAIDDIKKQLEDVAKRRDRCKVDEVVAKPAASSTIDPRLEAMYKEVTQLVGIDRAVSDLVSMLSLETDDMSINCKLEIVSVLGIGGLGKTTLAKAVYDEVKSQFSCWAFVSIGRNPNLEKVLRDILIDLDKHRYTSEVNVSIMDGRQLIDELRDFLGSKRYIIVIDDVWETKHWRTTRLAFIENNRGSRIISTTRKSEITSGTKVYKLQPLSYNNSKRLFYTRIFGEGKGPDNEVDEVSDKILNKCGGIPLSIITMASLLMGKSMGEWFEVCNSIGFRDKDIEQVDRTMEILSLSYYDLPHHLRTCLLYLSAFPEDYFIDKNSLIWRWIAEDFVHKKPGIRLFEVGEGYFHDLVNRSMIQAVESQHEDIVVGCQVHDMVLDLLRSLSREENFVTILDGDDGESSISSACRLSHQKNSLDMLLDNHKGVQKLRSYIAYGSDVGKELQFLSFKHLRVLGLENVRIESWHNAKHLGNLIHLRYLGLKHTNISELPKQIGALKYLQTLELLANFGIEAELPSSVGQLTQLVCLRAWGSVTSGTSMPNGVIKKLTSLEELLVQCDVDIDGEGQFMKDLGNLSELRVLTIKVIEMNQSMLSALLQSIGNLHNIQSLKLVPHFIFKGIYTGTFDTIALPRHLRHLLVRGHTFYKLPLCINPTCLINLSHLQLKVVAMDEQSMQILGVLPELRYLDLTMESTVTMTNIATAGCFQKLRSCKFPFSMVIFVLNKNSSVSFTLWNGRDDVLFPSRKKDEYRRAPAVMPSLEELLFEAKKWNMTKCEDSYGNLGLEYLTSLQKVTVTINCIRTAEVMEAEARLRHAIDVHPNHPTLILNRTGDESTQRNSILTKNYLGHDNRYSYNLLT